MPVQQRDERLVITGLANRALSRRLDPMAPHLLPQALATDPQALRGLDNPPFVQLQGFQQQALFMIFHRLLELEMYLGMSQAQANASGFRGIGEGGKLKEVGSAHWSSPNEGATNESSFTALPGGDRDDSGPFLGMGDYAYFWSATEGSSLSAWGRTLQCSYSQVARVDYIKPYGYSVRCVRD